MNVLFVYILPHVYDFNDGGIYHVGELRMQEHCLTKFISTPLNEQNMKWE